MGNQPSQDHRYHAYYQQLNQGHEVQQGVPPQKLPSPYEIFGLSKTFTLDELKNSYKRLLIIVHPDKGGTEQQFQYVTDCFKALYEQWKMREENKTHTELKTQSRDAYSKQTMHVPNPQIFSAESERFAVDKFNKLFDEHQLKDDEHEKGYGNVMAESNPIREDISIEKALPTFNEKKFNEVFQKKVPTSKALVHYEEPEALVLAKKLNFVEIGKTAKDFSDDGAHKKRSIMYADYMRAHTTERLIDPEQMKERESFKTVESYEKYRDELAKKELTSEERERLEARKRKEEEMEMHRLQRLKERDVRINEHFSRVQNLMLTQR